MTHPTDTPASPRVEPERVEHGPRRRALWALAAAFAVGTLAFWVWGLFVYDPGLLVDELADRTFPESAEKVCAVTVARIDELPRAEETPDPVARADVIDTANAELRTMVARLRPLAPAGPKDAAEAVGEWLDDWDDHIADRQAYADALRTDAGARFEERMKGSKQLSRAIDGFAQVNRMTSCETPGDV